MLADHIGIPQLRDLAGKSEQYSESVRVGAMSRLARSLYPESDQTDRCLSFNLSFLGGTQGFPEIRGRIRGALDVTCQRCLGPLAWAVDIELRLIVVGSEADLEFIPEPFDAIVAGEHGVCLTEIVEDELLTSLPLAPMHANGENCDPSTDTEIVDAEAESPRIEMNKPFGDLAAMLKNADSPNDE